MIQDFPAARNPTVNVLIPSIDIWNHEPPTLNLLSTEFLHVPLLRRLGRETEVDSDKDQAAQHGPVDHLTRRGSQQSERQVYNAFCPVMWTHDTAEDRMVWEGIFLQREQEVVAVVL